MRKVFGFGINDVEYNVTQREGDGYSKLIWTCPFYLKWHDMIRRTHSPVHQAKAPTYVGCTVEDGWAYLTQFKAWMETQEWLGKELDKDLLVPGNKHYGPETCVFLPSHINCFMSECTSRQGEWPVGVYREKCRNQYKFKAQCMSVVDGKKKNLGRYNTPEEAHQAWLTFKLEQAYILAEQQTDIRIADALVYRYENYSSL